MDDMVKEESLEFKTNTKFVDEFSKEVYEQTYRYGLENINQTQLRVAKDLASIEIDKDYWTKKFLWALEDFKGTVIMASHDRGLLDEVATKIIAFEDDGIHNFKGPLEEYLAT